jgi:hypothetical protein
MNNDNIHFGLFLKLEGLCMFVQSIAKLNFNHST